MTLLAFAKSYCVPFSYFVTAHCRLLNFKKFTKCVLSGERTKDAGEDYRFFPCTPPRRYIFTTVKHKTQSSKFNAVAEATNYVAVLTKTDTNKEIDLFCVGFAFYFADFRFVCLVV